MPSKPVRILHVISGLPVGGAQTMLFNLMKGFNKRDFEMSVVSLTDIGIVGRRLQEEGFTVHALNMNKGVPNPLALLRLVSLIRRHSPDIVQTWMYHADLLGGLGAKLARRPCVWNIRQSNFDPKYTRRMTLWTVRACTQLSHWLPKLIICNSQNAAQLHRRLGYRSNDLVVVPNGIDSSLFRPDNDAYQSVREELGLTSKRLLVGLIARFHPQKDHATFLEAAASVAQERNDVDFLLCGEGVTEDNDWLRSWLRIHSDVASRFHVLGIRQDIPRLSAALDVAVSSSAYGEGFSNAIVEAMASGVPCVVTDVGDSVAIVGDTGRTTSPRNAGELAAGIRDLLAAPEERLRLGRMARFKVEAEYSFDTAADQYAEIYRELDRSSYNSKIFGRLHG